MNYKETANRIVNWLKEYSVKNNRNGFIVGVSGGVDSALVSTLCAMTGLPTHCVIMPCLSKHDQTDRGHTHIHWLQQIYGTNNNDGNIRYHEFDLSETFKTFEELTQDHVYHELGYANTKSRLRMIMLYQIATCVGGLVVGTGNKVEDFGIGFFTKYGDGGVDISPIAGLTKTQVRAMAKELGILDELVNAIPTDGLWEDTRSDEDQIGASYEELEWAMEYENILPTDRPEITQRQTHVLDIYKKFNTQNKHKMVAIPTFIP